MKHWEVFLTDSQFESQQACNSTDIFTNTFQCLRTRSSHWLLSCLLNQLFSKKNDVFLYHFYFIHWLSLLCNCCQTLSRWSISKRCLGSCIAPICNSAYQLHSGRSEDLRCVFHAYGSKNACILFLKTIHQPDGWSDQISLAMMFLRIWSSLQKIFVLHHFRHFHHFRYSIAVFKLSYSLKFHKARGLSTNAKCGVHHFWGLKMTGFFRPYLDYVQVRQLSF